LHLTKHHANWIMEENQLFLYDLSMDTNLAPPKKSSGANDISIFVHVLSFECCEILRTFEY